MQSYLTRGVRYMLAGTFLFAVGTACIKAAGARIPALEILFGRGVVSILYCLIVLRRAGVSHYFGKPENRRLLMLRGLFGCLALATAFTAIVRLPLADAMVLIFMFPVFVALFAVPFLGERMSLASVFCVLTSLAGGVLVTKPSFLFGMGHPLDSIGLAAGMASAVFSGISIITIHKVSRREHPLVVVIYQPLAILLLAPLMGVGSWVMPQGNEWLLLFAVGAIMTLGQHLMTMAYAVGEAGKMAAINYTEIAYAAVFGYFLFNEIPDVYTIIGAVMIILGTALLGRQSSH